MDTISLLFHLLLVDPMTNVLVGTARAFGGNFGVAIIIFTLLMRFVTWPLTASQYKQSRKMQEIQPRLQELQKKYKGKDPKKMQQEQMALYKEAGVNPLGCLLPMLVQMPIWIALYQVIRLTLGETPESLVTLSHRLYPIPYVHDAVPLSNRFLFWNLGQPDTTLILPVLVAITMYVQQKLITPTPTAATTPQQQQQQQTQQMMTWMMPLIFGFWTLNVPAGLGLYWAVTNLSGIVLQYFYMGRRMDWRSLFVLSPAPSPAATARPRAQAEGRPAGRALRDGGDAAAKRDVRSAAPLTAPAADITVNESGQAAMPGARSARRTRNGRRRGKR